MGDLYDQRLSYERAILDEQHMLADPLLQFDVWFKTALETEKNEAYAMSLATADAQAKPSVRIVLLRHYSAQGFVFFTHYLSAKGVQLEQNPQAELLFYWPLCEQQVRIHGNIKRLNANESDAYFEQRPRDSRIAAHVSQPQSGVVDGRHTLETRFDALHAQWSNNAPIPRPSHWGGYVLEPCQYEFWQGGRHRLHDRIQYVAQPQGWLKQRLMP